MNLRQLERIMAVVDRCLRKEFPDDFHKRCMYAAAGISALLRDAGIASERVGGEFLAFVVAKNGTRAGLQGFGFGRDEFSHFWVEAGGYLIDLGPYYLPQDTSYPAAKTPAVAWSLTSPFPSFLRYREQARWPADAIITDDPLINARTDRLVAACRQRMSLQQGPLASSLWLLTGMESVAAAAAKRDPWAKAALRFESTPAMHSAPF